MGQHVVIIGGGVAGLTAAHELIERGYEVSVFEQRARIPGGKARTEPFAGSGSEGRGPLPGEHGFRFFPNFYRHTDDTMRRIPFPGNPRGVLDNIISVQRGVFARVGMPWFQILVRSPQSLGDLRVALAIPGHLRAQGLTLGDGIFFARSMFQFLTSCEARRFEDYERISWWDFVGAAGRSKAYQLILATGMTRNAVALKAHLASTRTIGRVGVQIGLDMMIPGRSGDRILNGPTNAAWIDPWLNHLRAEGVQYHLGHRVTEVHFEHDELTGITVTTPDGVTKKIVGDHYICALPVEVAARLLPESLKDFDPNIRNLDLLKERVAWMNGIQYFLRQDTPITPGHINCLGTPWALTAISETQFWPDVDMTQLGDGTIEAILSVDISDWTIPGMPGGPAGEKAARDCTRDEIIEETWFQLKASLNTGSTPFLSDYHSVWLDSDIQPDPDGSPHAQINLEPLLVNEINTWSLRPNAWTKVPNFYLASDYVRTNTDFASMEAANEAARRAVNTILTRTHYCGARGLAEIWDFDEPMILDIFKAYDQWRYTRGMPWASITELPVDLWRELMQALAQCVERLAALGRALNPLTLLAKLRDLVEHLFGRHETTYDRVQGILGRNAGGPVPFPFERPWIGYQRWSDLLFLHWRVKPEDLRPLVPAELELDLWEGDAWLTVIPMYMADLEMTVLGDVPFANAFPELNIRTYVKHNGRTGVYFLRIDAPNALADIAADLFFHLPYGRAAQSLERVGDTTHFSSHRTSPPTPDASIRVHYTPTGAPFKPAAGSRERFLVERYASFARAPDGDILRGDLIHDPWIVQPVDATIDYNSILDALGITPLSSAPEMLYSRGTEAVVWAPINADEP